MEKQIKLCTASPLYHPNMGGSGRLAVTFTEEYFSKGGSVFVFCRKILGLPLYAFNPDIKIYSLRSIYPSIYDLEKMSLKNVLISVSFSACLIIALIKKRKEFDIIHFFGAGLPLIFSTLFLKIMKKKIVATVLAANLGNEAGSLRSRYFPVGMFMNSILKRVDFFIAMTEEIENALLNDGCQKDRIKRIPNWVDTNRFCPVDPAIKSFLRKKLGLDDSLLVLFIGRLVYRKGADLLIKAWKEVISDNPSCVLVLAGAGIEQNNLESLLRDMGMEKNVLFLGHINNADEYLKAVDIFVFPSRQEGMPTILLDAMACGLPVIASKIGGVVDVLEDGKEGILFEHEDVSGLSAALDRLIRNKKTRDRLGAEARKKIVETFSIDRVTDEYIKLYKCL